MPFYINNKTSVLFIHIPRTGGSSFEKFLRVNKKFRDILGQVLQMIFLKMKN